MNITVGQFILVVVITFIAGAAISATLLVAVATRRQYQADLEANTNEEQK